jgi:ribosome-associated protein
LVANLKGILKVLKKKEQIVEDDEILRIVKKTLDEGKAENIVTIDLRGKTSIANEMVVASGTSDRHVISLAQKIQENLKAAGYKSISEGIEKGDWVLIDAFDVIVHIFRPEVREFYNLEKMWNSIANLRKE